jgi:hypothetical protein
MIDFSVCFTGFGFWNREKIITRVAMFNFSFWYRLEGLGKITITILPTFLNIGADLTVSRTGIDGVSSVFQV